MWLTNRTSFLGRNTYGKHLIFNNSVITFSFAILPILQKNTIEGPVKWSFGIVEWATEPVSSRDIHARVSDSVRPYQCRTI